MPKRLARKCISWLLVVVMLISNMPLSALAETTEVHQHTEECESSTDTSETLEFDVESDDEDDLESDLTEDSSDEELSESVENEESEDTSADTDEDNDANTVPEEDEEISDEEETDETPESDVTEETTEEETEALPEEGEVTVAPELGTVDTVVGDASSEVIPETGSNTIVAETGSNAILYEEYLEELNDLLNKYGIAEGMSEADMEAIVEEMSSDEIDEAKAEIDAWFDSVEELELNEDEKVELLEAAELLEMFYDVLDGYAVDSELAQVKAQIDEILMKYLGATVMSEDEVRNTFIDMDWELVFNAWEDIDEFVNTNSNLGLTDGEIRVLEEKNVTFFYFCDGLNDRMKENPYSISLLADAGPFAILDNQITINSSGSSSADTGVNNGDGSYTFQAWASGGWRGSTNTITFTNNTEMTVVVSFDYSLSGDCSSSSLGVTSGSGSYSLEKLAPGASTSISITGKGGMLSGAEVQLTLSNFSLEEVIQTYKVTFAYNSDLGQVKVDGTEVANGSSLDLVGATLEASPSSGAEFVAWVNSESNVILSTDTSYKIVFEEDITIGAVFVDVDTESFYKVDNILYSDLTSAITASGSASDKKIVLMCNGTLPAGDYTIPSDVTLLIPFDANDTCYTTKPGKTVTSSISAPKAFRTLAMAANANIIVNGTMSVSAKQVAAGGGQRASGMPYETYGYVKTATGSSITVNSGGKLCVYGYISGNGTVLAKSGAKIYESFQFEDFRGGSQTDGMKNKVFALSQYYVQNIEVAMTLEAGATEYSYAAIEVSDIAWGSSVAFISNSGAMFNLTDGTVTKKYDKATDRLIIEANDGQMTIEPLSLKISIYSINSENYVLPINGNMTIKINGGDITLNQDVALLPGAEIVIDEEATCILGEGTYIYVYDSEQWGNYVGSSDAKILPVYYVPERKYTRTESDLVDAKIEVRGTVNASSGTVDATSGYFYTTSGGAQIVGTEGASIEITPEPDAITYQFSQKSSTYTEIPVTSARLLNGDGSYTETTSDDTATTVIYRYHRSGTDGKWIACDTYFYESEDTIPVTCLTNGLRTYTCRGCGDSYTEVIVARGSHAYNSVETKPTCTAQGYTTYTCEDCGDSYVTDYTDALSHSYEVEVTEPTCTAQGYTTHTCSRCGDSYVDSYTEMANHSYESVTVDATCTEDGKTTYTCSVCGTWYEEVIKSEGHAYESVVTDPTCEAGGYTTYTCSKCGDSYTGDETAKLSHSYKVVVTDPTCTTDGYITYTCSECGYSYQDDGEVAPGHTAKAAVEENRVEATCTEDGSYDSVVYCGVCGEEISRTANTISAPGHTAADEVEENRVEATCTEDGSYDVVVYCSVCEKEISRTTNTISASGHTAADAVEENRVEATCTSAGSYDVVVYCSVCEDEISRETNSIDVLAHTWSDTVVTAPTCTENGETSRVCTECGATTTIYPDALNHDMVYEYVEAKSPTCTESGLSTSGHCQRENCDYVTGAEEIPALDHDWDEGTVTTEPTCNSTGIRTYKCQRTGCSEERTEGIDLVAHTEDEAVMENYIASSCTEVGSYDMVVYCSVCGEELNRTDYTVDMVDHTASNAVEENRVEAKCETAGSYDMTVYCAECGVELERTSYTIPKLDHDWNEEGTVTKDPTCTEKGVMTYTCNRDNTHIYEEEIDTIAHSYESKVTEPTCTKQGYTTYTCSVCNDSYIADKVSQTGHSLSSVVTAPTCTEEGYTTYTCSKCDYIRVADETEALKHDYVDVVTAPTCTEEGYTTHTCRRCGDVYVDAEVEALKHTVVVDEKVDATCTATGLTEGSHCSVCGETLVEQQVLEMLAHTTVVDEAKDATCAETGLTEGSHCSVCGEVLVEQQVLEKLEHTVVVDEAKDATCAETGLTEGSHCSVCGEVFVAQNEIPTYPHSEITLKAVAATCTETGLSSGKICSVCGTITKEQTVIKELGHDLMYLAAQNPTYTEIGWEAYETCTRCEYSTYVEIPALGEVSIDTFEEFIENLSILEELTDYYVKKVSPGKDPVSLIIKYIRTGVDRYNSGSWNIMAGYEDADFAQYIAQYEADYNDGIENVEDMLAVSGLKNIENFYLPNGDYADIGHMFGTMDISYTNKSSVNHADVAGWAGDLVDLLSLADQFGVESTTVEDLVTEITDKYLMKYEEDFDEEPIEGTFSQTDMYGDLDGFYVIQQLYAQDYENGTLTSIISDYMTEDLTDVQRADYFLKNRLGGLNLRDDVREEVYTEYLTNGVIGTLEGTREFFSDNLDDMREACCYAFADYICKLAGDYVEVRENVYYNVFSTENSTLAPGITQQIKLAETADDKQMKFYIATADLSNENVHVYANYKDNDPSLGWGMSRVADQMTAAQEKYGDPESDLYIENYNVIAGINGSGFNMSTGEPSGLLVMNGVTYHPVESSGFFAILDDGTAKIGTNEEYAEYKDRIMEGIASFGTTLVKDGEVCITVSSDYYTSRASRTAAGITKTGKVVFMVLDGRQGDYSCGGSMEEIAQIMLEAGCYQAINLDGGGSSTYVARPEGEETFRVVSSPSDGVARSVSTSLMMVSTAPSSTAFDHAVLDSEYSYLTVGSSTELTASAVSATGNKVDVPEGTTWAVSDETVGTITEDGVFTAKSEGTVSVNLMLDGEVVGTKTLYVVTPDNLYFEKDTIRAIYGEPVKVPVKAVYEGKQVAIQEDDVVLSLGNAAAGEIDGLYFTADEESGLKVAKIIATLAADSSITASITANLYSADEVSFDFDDATGGDRQLAWEREVSNSVQENTDIYRAVDTDEDMVTSYTFAIDMSKIDIPERLSDLTYMLPGADLENASAWTFLLQLAERISVLTEVRPVLYFDKNLDVDYSDMTVVNEYFKLNDTIFDEEENSLTLVLNWVDQKEPIDADTANPLCILSGIKLTPKSDAAWSSSNQMTVVNSGEIAYKVYMRANALYTFSQKEENQKIYGLYSFVNPDDENEKGGYFGSTYKEFEDRYTLINTNKDGWVIESTGYAYYANGERYTGICEVDGYYYDFGTDGINKNKTKYNGEMFDANGNEYYIKGGLKQSGWLVLDEDVRYYNPTTCIREKLTADETPSTCIIDGYCVYTSESGEVKRVDYDDAGGHEYVKQADGSYVCSVCGHVRIEMEDVNVTLSRYVYTYDGTAKTPSTKAVTTDGRVLTKPGQTDYPEYYSTYRNNIDVGTATVTLTARKYGVYVNMTEWRGNAAGSITVPYTILPDLPTGLTAAKDGSTCVLSWNAAGAPGVTYVIYKSTNGSTWKEFDTTTDTEYAVAKADGSGCYFKLGTRKEVDGVVYESANLTSSVKAVYSSSSSGGSGGGGGGGGGGSSSSGKTTTTTTTNTLTNANGEALPSYVVSGSWTLTTEGKWMFTDGDTVVYKSAWAAVYNPYANTAIGQSDFDWFYFDANGCMVTGWLYYDGHWYYLHTVSDGTLGRMYTGWNQIDGKWYYFNTVSDGTRGALMTDTWIDGYYVDANGVWDGQPQVSN